MSEIIFENTTNNITFAVDQPQINFQHTQPQISFTAVPGIGSGIEEAPIDGISYLRENGAWIKRGVLTEETTVTVAADGMPAGVQDFDTFHEAMTWACNQFISGTSLTLLLEDGTHYIGDPDTYNTTMNAYYVVDGGANIFLRSSSGIQDNVIITMPNISTPNNRNIFMARSSYFSPRNLTVDLSAGGLSGVNTNVVVFWYGATTYMTGVKIANCNHAVTSYGGSTVQVAGCLIENVVNGVRATTNAYLLSIQTTYNNCETAVNAFYSSKINLLVGDEFNGNTNDFNIPINTIQQDGSIITDGTVPLTMADSHGLTANRPTGDLNINTQYLDETLGYSVWWNGTNWVDATGSIV